jgi:hypothetical protein
MRLTVSTHNGAAVVVFKIQRISALSFFFANLFERDAFGLCCPTLD